MQPILSVLPAHVCLQMANFVSSVSRIPKRIPSADVRKDTLIQSFSRDFFVLRNCKKRRNDTFESFYLRMSWSADADPPPLPAAHRLTGPLGIPLSVHRRAVRARRLVRAARPGVRRPRPGAEAAARWVERFGRRGTEPNELFRSEFVQNSCKIQEF